MVEPLAYRIKDITRPNGPHGKTKIYEAIKNGELIAHKDGRVTLILADNYKAYLEKLPPVQSR
jgi:excisionase family DNA binding protein